MILYIVKELLCHTHHKANTITFEIEKTKLFFLPVLL